MLEKIIEKYKKDIFDLMNIPFCLGKDKIINGIIRNASMMKVNVEREFKYHFRK